MEVAGILAGGRPAANQRPHSDFLYSILHSCLSEPRIDFWDFDICIGIGIFDICAFFFFGLQCAD